MVVNKGDKPGAQRTAAQLRAMLVASAPRDGDSDGTRPRPRRPDVLITTAVTGEGVPELLAALDRHRRSGRDGASAAARLARLSRAEQQIWAIVNERLKASLVVPARRAATDHVFEEVAAHRLDPYAAADKLLDVLFRPPETGPVSRP